MGFIRSPPTVSTLYFLWLFSLLLGFFVLFSSASFEAIPRLRPFKKYNFKSPDSVKLSRTLSDFSTFFYNQTLDHFNYRPESYVTFQQKYVINSKYWGGADAAAPIFVLLGDEGPIEDDIEGIGFLPENAASFRALLIYIEHRFYGKSVPYGSKREAMRNASIRGYFNSAQALADYAEVIRHLKQQLSADSSPVIVIGASYGGMLAAWFRLKYPHMALGALASSAPILYFDNITPEDGYSSVVTRDFKEASESCYNTIRKSWSQIDKFAATPNGLSRLSKKFKTCKRLKNTEELNEHLRNAYSAAAQYDEPPEFPVTKMCKAIDGAASNGIDILGQIFAGMVAFDGNKSCYDLEPYFSSETINGWDWQTCSDITIRMGRGNNTLFGAADPFDLNKYLKYCKNKYGVTPRPLWITTYYGGHHIKLILKKFGSNIIFSNGLRDPYSSGGVLEDISDSVVAVYTVEGSHCLDVSAAQKNDPNWLVLQRSKEVQIIKGWILKYYEDLHQTS
ncbi:uncharacterized protein LOC131166533 [Malania oleifera]|uniref:uncharacterized protein LOC131166533 n=1 Tax=Malania oleifera TaxID=397392 RepID=UPI0025AE3EEB|nr:uncharacterized protein LOC131166533 [Malania oleifera]